MWRLTTAPSTFDLTINLSYRFIGSYWLCPTSTSIGHAMLSPRLFSLGGECWYCSAPTSDWFEIPHNCILAIVCLHRSVANAALDVPCPTWHSSVSVVRNNWHRFKPSRLATGQGYCIIKSDQPKGSCDLSVNPLVVAAIESTRGSSEIPLRTIGLATCIV